MPLCGSWEHHTRRLDPRSGYPPAPAVGQRHSTDKVDIGRYRRSTICDFYFQLAACQVGRAPPWTACRVTQPPRGYGRSSCRRLQTPGRLGQKKFFVALMRPPPPRANRECTPPSRAGPCLPPWQMGPLDGLPPAPPMGRPP
jgi:hypothetical protein